MNIKRIFCLIGNHDWTSKAEEGIKPEFEKNLENMTALEIYDHFNDYSQMYCKQCGKIYIPKN